MLLALSATAPLPPVNEVSTTKYPHRILNRPAAAQQPSRPFQAPPKDSGYLQHAEDLNEEIEDIDAVHGEMLNDVYYIDRTAVSPETMVTYCKTQTRHTETSCDYVVSFRRGTGIDDMEHVVKEVEQAGGEIEMTTWSKSWWDPVRWGINFVTAIIPDEYVPVLATHKAVKYVEPDVWYKTGGTSLDNTAISPPPRSRGVVFSPRPPAPPFPPPHIRPPSKPQTEEGAFRFWGVPFSDASDASHEQALQQHPQDQAVGDTGKTAGSVSIAAVGMASSMGFALGALLALGWQRRRNRANGQRLVMRRSSAQAAPNIGTAGQSRLHANACSLMGGA